MTDIGTLRAPDTLRPEVMTRRGWLLMVLNFLVPGLPQVVAGNRRLGRLGLITTFVTWVAAIAAVVIAIVDRNLLLSAATNSLVLVAGQVVLVYWAILLVILTINTLRIVKVVRLVPRSRVILPTAMLVVLALFGGAAAYGVVQIGVLRGFLGDVFSASSIADPVDGRYNILLLGGDAGKGREGLRPDSVSVVSVDAETGASVVIGIPRNLEDAPFPADSPMAAQFPNGFDHLTSITGEPYFNAIYTEAMNADTNLYPDAEANGSSAGIEATKDAAEGVTGLSIQYFVLIDMKGFKNLIDALGGITVTVDEPLHLLTGNCQGVLKDNGWIEAGTQTMDGRTALLYARARCTTTDYDRMLRQRKVQAAILKQFDPLTVVTKFQAIAEAGKSIVETDIPQGAVSRFADLGTKAQKLDMVTLELTPANGINTAEPDFDEIHSMVQSAIAESRSAADSSSSAP